MTRQEQVTLVALGLAALLALGILAWQRRTPLLQMEGAASMVEEEVFDARLAAARTVDVNTASASDLARLPEIGPALAQRIVAYRARHGHFREPRELLQVNGIGPRTLEAIEEHITVR